jgi:hypothetical protein
MVNDVKPTAVRRLTAILVVLAGLMALAAQAAPASARPASAQPGARPAAQASAARPVAAGRTSGAPAASALPLALPLASAIVTGVAQQDGAAHQISTPAPGVLRSRTGRANL